MKTKKVYVCSILLAVIGITMSCSGAYINPNRVDAYDHKYDELEVSEIEKEDVTYTYKDYGDKNAYGLRYSPAYGNPKFLVVPIWFTDSDEYIANKELVREDIETTYFGTEKETGWESVKTYYQKDSFGHVDIDGMVTPWFECGDASSKYYSSNRTTRLIKNVYNWLAEQYGDLTEYDSDSDGYLDSLVLIYGCPDQYYMYWHKHTDCSNLWAYTSWTGQYAPSLTAPKPMVFFWASYDFMYGDDAADHTGACDFGNGDTNYCNVDAHTFIHETGHVFGLNDYYDYSGEGAPGLSFSMQDHNVGAHDPFSRIALGWVDPIVPTETCKIEIEPFEDSGDVILLSPEFTGSPFDEYILLELFTPTGLNEQDCTYNYSGYYPLGPQNAGIRMWHVDSRLFKLTRYYPTTGKYEGYVTSEVSYGVMHATSNTAPGGQGATDLAGSYDYHQLSVIRRGYKLIDENGEEIPDTERRYSNFIGDADLFRTDDYFTLHNYRAQFVEDEKFNNGEKFSWSIYFNEVSDEGATITLIK